MIALSLQFETAQAQILLNLLKAVNGPDPLMQLIGRAVAGETKAHYRALHLTNPNKMGGKRQNFWLGVADSVQQPKVGMATATVAISHPVIAHKAGLGPAGGTITPKRRKWLALPAKKEAYGLSPISYAQGTATERVLRFVQFSPELAALLEITGQGPKGGKKWGVAYWLRKEVKQKPMANALPSEEKLKPVVVEVIDNFLAALALVD